MDGTQAEKMENVVEVASFFDALFKRIMTMLRYHIIFVTKATLLPLGNLALPYCIVLHYQKCPQEIR